MKPSIHHGSAAIIGTPLTVVTVDEPAVVELNERSLALVRPGQHVAWRGAALADNPYVLLKKVASLTTIGRNSCRR